MERSLAEGLPAAEDPGWIYPPALLVDTPREPPVARGTLALLVVVVAVAVIAFMAGVVEGATIAA